jgi:hypothetical protein
MKKLVFQINVPFYSKNNPQHYEYQYNQEMYDISQRNAMRYASKFQCDYYVVTKIDEYSLAAGKHLDYQKLKMYDFSEYDVILYLDSDYIIKDNAPDLFQLCGNKFHAVPEQGKGVCKKADNLQIDPHRYFNAGFMYLPKFVFDKTRENLVKYIDKEYNLQGQGLLNKLFFDHDINFTPLDYMQWNPVKATFGLYADHYSGKNKSRWGKVSY